jgi:hypothetical protein
MKNFQPTHFNNGDIIPLAKNIEQFSVWFLEVKTPYRIELNGTTYYNKYAVEDPRGLVPAGYRYPTPQDDFSNFPRRSYVCETSLNYGRALGGCWLEQNTRIGAFKDIESAQAIIIDYWDSCKAMPMPKTWGFELYFVKI